MEHHRTPTVADICKKIGRDVIADGVGVGLTAVGNAVSANCFPSSWFMVVSALCAEAAVECPPSLFAFKGVEPQRVDAA